ncbi:hypothetical protein K438DRAFT_2026731 [Mycena galopus ATCC 62051]|nr:hypothetical protein K438DRAFT_2026731 [Mycena galopus ATCC 62051]
MRIVASGGMHSLSLCDFCAGDLDVRLLDFDGVRLRDRAGVPALDWIKATSLPTICPATSCRPRLFLLNFVAFSPIAAMMSTQILGGAVVELQELEVRELVKAYYSSISIKRAAPSQLFETQPAWLTGLSLESTSQMSRASVLAPCPPSEYISSPSEAQVFIFACNITSTTTDLCLVPLPSDGTEWILDGFALLLPASLSALSASTAARQSLRTLRGECSTASLPRRILSILVIRGEILNHTLRRSSTSAAGAPFAAHRITA